jgi:hypothetical protein
MEFAEYQASREETRQTGPNGPHGRPFGAERRQA